MYDIRLVLPYLPGHLLGSLVVVAEVAEAGLRRDVRFCFNPKLLERTLQCRSIRKTESNVANMIASQLGHPKSGDLHTTYPRPGHNVRNCQSAFSRLMVTHAFYSL